MILLLLNSLYLKNTTKLTLDNLHIYPNDRVEEMFVLHDGILTVMPVKSSKGQGNVKIKLSKNKKYAIIELDGQKLCFNGPDYEIGTCDGKGEEVKWRLCPHKKEYKLMSAKMGGNGKKYCMSIEKDDTIVVARECKAKDKKQRFWVVPTKYFNDGEDDDDEGECDEDENYTIDDIFEKLFKNEKFDISELHTSNEISESNEHEYKTYKESKEEEGKNDKKEETSNNTQGIAPLPYQYYQTPVYNQQPMVGVMPSTSQNYQYGQQIQPPPFFSQGYGQAPQMYSPYQSAESLNTNSPVATVTMTVEPKTVVVTTYSEKIIVQTTTATSIVTKYVSLPQTTIVQQCTATKVVEEPAAFQSPQKEYQKIARSVVQLSNENENQKQTNNSAIKEAQKAINQTEQNKCNEEIKSQLTNEIAQQMSVKVKDVKQTDKKKSIVDTPSIPMSSSLPVTLQECTVTVTQPAVVPPAAPVQTVTQAVTPALPTPGTLIPVAPTVPVVPSPVTPTNATPVPIQPANPVSNTSSPTANPDTSQIFPVAQDQTTECVSSTPTAVTGSTQESGALSSETTPTTDIADSDPSKVDAVNDITTKESINDLQKCIENGNHVQHIGPINIEFTDDKSDESAQNSADDLINYNVCKDVSDTFSQTKDGNPSQGEKVEKCEDEKVNSFNTVDGVVEVFKDANGRYYINGGMPSCDVGLFTIQCK